MSLIEKARAFVARVHRDEAQPKHVTLATPDELRYWVCCLLDCHKIEDVQRVLTGFSERNCWTLEQRSIVSAIYTPRALKMLSRDEDSKRKWIEDLAELCWNTKKESPNG